MTQITTPQPEWQLAQCPELKTTLAHRCPSMCRCCQFYKFQGRCGGYCHKLGVPVCSYWRSCPFALLPFAPSWEGSGKD